MVRQRHIELSNDEPTAPETYAKRQDDIARLIDILTEELSRHKQKADADQTNWGFAGDLGKVRSDLMDAVAFLSGFTREDVEEFLED